MLVEILDNTDVEPYCSVGEVLKMLQVYPDMQTCLVRGEEVHFIIPQSQVKEVKDN
ncbi:hypothetical protein HB839_13550 [Listeria sp. FSL L7-1699]|uniref:Uncharacterized protein n=1 Tax=Listeria farberi TaxID=2713500 RepID=A0ABR6SQV7_9LIST|nr:MULTISPECIES: hypothetical protein [Listeria]MBC2290464.1 hypothetical protein [Listeria welshimeri]EEO6560721.1 hypothetical protein [Listeria monocytogenes]EEO9072218.1 hypothetical protein [Listeria monocytogenes]EIZ1591934.1 hypothetical protein [Listeria monocytogenes]EKZ4625912.1 hypothetical protein [Listeria monocytogenes]